MQRNVNDLRSIQLQTNLVQAYLVVFQRLSEQQNVTNIVDIAMKSKRVSKVIANYTKTTTSNVNKIHKQQ